MLGVALNEVFVPDPAEAVSGDRRLLPAARGLQLPHGGDLHPARPTRATPSG
ncbi:MAG: hypothetical protein MZW92_22585 [Comamonadaceae bacterium]|nr:hypothetical protein [Comamonadaceae bacterium]